jgi:hypothetical protein
MKPLRRLIPFNRKTISQFPNRALNHDPCLGSQCQVELHGFHYPIMAGSPSPAAWPHTAFTSMRASSALRDISLGPAQGEGRST